MPRWTHKPTWSDDRDDGRDDDHVILRDGVRIGRVYRELFGPLKGQWQFYGMWAGHDSRGQTETLEEALEAIRQRAPADELVYYKLKQETARRRGALQGATDQLIVDARVSLVRWVEADVTSEPDITEVLERYNCPYPPTVVRMRFWGAINSPAAHVSPIEEIDALWSGKRRPFESEDEAEAFYDVMISFWNELAENRASGKPVDFSMRSGLKTIAGLKSAMAARYAELNGGFYSGFIGNLRPHDPVDSNIDRNLDKLSDVIDEIEELMEGPIGPSNANKVRSRFVALDKRAQKLVNQTVMQTWVVARGRSH